MDSDGGTAKYPTNTAGAKYGTGYCDSQCPRDLKYIDGQANVDGWTASSNNANTGIGGHGSCCSEMDIWEANSISEAVTPHPCSTVGQSMCDGDACGGTYSTNRYAGECDPDGCDWNPYRLGDHTFYGPGSSFVVDSTMPFTVVTQFAGSGTTLSSINRYYVQGGTVFAQPDATDVPGYTGNEITAAYCTAEEAAFGGTSFTDKGGLPQMAKALSGGMVLVMSLWDDVSRPFPPVYPLLLTPLRNRLTLCFSLCPDSTPSTCSGLTPPTRPTTLPATPVPPVAPAPPTPVCPLRSRPTRPAPRSSSPTSSSAPSTAPSPAPPATAALPPAPAAASPCPPTPPRALPPTPRPLPLPAAAPRPSGDSAVARVTLVPRSALLEPPARPLTPTTLSACRGPLVRRLISMSNQLTGCLLSLGKS